MTKTKETQDRKSAARAIVNQTPEGQRRVASAVRRAITAARIRHAWLDPQPADIDDLRQETYRRAIERIASRGWSSDPNRDANAALFYGARYALVDYMRDAARRGMTGDNRYAPEYGAADGIDSAAAPDMGDDAAYSELLLSLNNTDRETAEALIVASDYADVGPTLVGELLGISRQAAAQRIAKLRERITDFGQRRLASIVCSALQVCLTAQR